MKASLAAAIAAAFALTIAGPAGAHLVTKPKSSSLEHRQESQAENLAHARYVCRRGGGEHRRWSCAARLWLAVELDRTRAELHRREQARLSAALGRVGDYSTAVRQVERYFGPQPFLWACPHSEGGFGAWVPNRHGSGAGGWLQFKAGTFYGVIDDAIDEARERGMPVPRGARSWYSPLGQALAGVEMLSQGRRGEWTGSTC